MTASTFNKGDAYRRGRRVARHLIQTEGADRLRGMVEEGERLIEAGQLSGPALHEHWGAKSILREEA